MKIIESAANPLIKTTSHLRTARGRQESGLILIEGAAEILAYVEAGHSVETLLVTDPNHADATAVSKEVVLVTGAAIDRAFVRKRGGDALAIGPRPVALLSDLPSTASLMVLAESLEKPGNLGAMLRSADAAGVDGVIVCDPAVDPFSPNVIRASLGTVFSVPLAVSDLADAVAWCAARLLPIVSLDPGAVTLLFDYDLTGPIAVAVGAEHAGLSDELRAASSAQLALPMSGSADSLNAATALAVALFETVRQRR